MQKIQVPRLAAFGFLWLQMSATFTVTAQEPEAADTKTVWHDVQEWGVEGKGWTNTATYFDRLPAGAKSKVPLPVWNLSRQSAGLSVQFETNATEIWFEYELLSSQMALPHMPATGVSGIDLYAKVDDDNFRWLACTKPTEQNDQVKVVGSLPRTTKQFMAYLPLYNGMKSLRIGVPAKEGIEFVGLAPRSISPVVFYGTSITQGACASRPGMAHAAILGRRLDRPTINLGFSGNGKMELAVAELLGEIDACLYIIDCLPNMNAQLVSDRTVPFVTRLRELRPETPIILVEDRTYGNSWALPSRKQRQDSSRAALAEAMKQLGSLPGPKIELIGGEGILGPDSTTDGSHPSDLGFQEYADAFEPTIRKVLNACPSEED